MLALILFHKASWDFGPVLKELQRAVSELKQ